jgi:hypothetical protein
MKKIVISSFLAVFLMMMLPIASAAGEHIAGAPKISKTSTQETTIQALREKSGTNPEPQTVIILTIAILILKFLRWGAVFIEGLIFLTLLKILRRPHNVTGLA